MSVEEVPIKVEGITKVFRSRMRGREVRALSEVSLEVRRGEIFGLLGPNGAGKTTLIKILLGSLRPGAGWARINGYEVTQSGARDKVGYLPENHRFPSYLTGRQLLMIYGGMAGIDTSELKKKIPGLLELVGMKGWERNGIKEYSKGMMQRLGVAQVLISDPDILFLDEPTDGVDPIGRHAIRNIFLEQKRQGRTMFLNTHLLSEAEAICDRVAVLDKGRVVKVGSPRELVEIGIQYTIETAGLDSGTTDELTQKFDRVTISGGTIGVILDKADEINGLIDLLRARQVMIISVAPQKLSLEESFIRLIKGDRRET